MKYDDKFSFVLTCGQDMMIESQFYFNAWKRFYDNIILFHFNMRMRYDDTFHCEA